MDPYPLVAIAFVTLSVVTLLAARAGAVALGILPGRSEHVGVAGDADPDADADVGERVRPPTDASDGSDESAPSADEADGWRITEDDRKRMRRHLDKARSRRSPDDLLPSEAYDADSEGS